MKKYTFLCVIILVFGANLSLKAQTVDERAQFYKDYKNGVSNKTAIINSDPDLYQKGLSNVWFQKAAAGLKNAEAYANGNNWNSSGSPQAPASGNGFCADATPFCTSTGNPINVSPTLTTIYPENFIYL